MYKLICVVSAILISVTVQVNSLQCYQCENCAKVTDNELVTCGSTTTPAPSTGTTQTGGTSTQTSAGTTQTGGSSTQTSAGTTQTGGSSTQTSAGTTQTSESTTQTSAGSTQTSQSTTQTSAGSTQTSQSTTQTSAGSTQTSASTTQASSGSTQTNEGSSQPDNGEAVNPETDPEEISVRRLKRAIFDSRADLAYACATLKYTENNTQIISRGCLLDQGNETSTCSILTELGYNGTCSICKTDKCNSATSLQVSAFIMLASFVIGSIYYN